MVSKKHGPPPEDDGMEVIEAGPMMLLPPAPDRCQVCATKHEPGMPHNRDSLFYQVTFQQHYGRAPTWDDCLAHCSEHMKAHWRRELEKAGHWDDGRVSS